MDTREDFRAQTFGISRFQQHAWIGNTMHGPVLPRAENEPENRVFSKRPIEDTPFRNGARPVYDGASEIFEGTRARQGLSTL